MSDAASSTNNSTASCAKCNTTAGHLKKCAKCKSTWYCGRPCQQGHWKEHKKECRRFAANAAEAPTGAAGNPFQAIQANTFLHGRPEPETFKLLVDILRMRQEDAYNFDCHHMPGTIYNEEPSSEPAFREMIRRAKAVNGLLPPWWSDEKEEECIRLNRANLGFAAEKHDIQQEHGDSMMPMKLRLVGQRIYGSQPGDPSGRGGESVLSQMAGLAGGPISHVDLAR